jgi:hypothetical protein
MPENELLIMGLFASSAILPVYQGRISTKKLQVHDLCASETDLARKAPLVNVAPGTILSRIDP